MVVPAEPICSEEVTPARIVIAPVLLRFSVSFASPITNAPASPVVTPKSMLLMLMKSPRLIVPLPVVLKVALSALAKLPAVVLPGVPVGVQFAVLRQLLSTPPLFQTPSATADDAVNHAQAATNTATDADSGDGLGRDLLRQSKFGRADAVAASRCELPKQESGEGDSSRTMERAGDRSDERDNGESRAYDDKFRSA